MSNIKVQDRKDQFAEIVTMIQHTRNEVVRLANASLIDLYWKVGKYISDKISISEWGDGVVKQLADYIERNSPEAKGFSDKNLWRMKQFYETYKDADEKFSAVLREIVPQAEQMFRVQFVVAVGRAMESCKTLDISIDCHFREVTKMIFRKASSIGITPKRLKSIIALQKANESINKLWLVPVSI